MHFVSTSSIPNRANQGPLNLFKNVKKKCLTSYSGDGIGLKNFNIFVFCIHKLGKREEVMKS
jgi:hypothetical protein